MDASDVMQMAADHAAKAEEYEAQGAPSQARLHIEHSKLLVAMARETRIGSLRHRAYDRVVFKPVVVAEPVGPSTGDGVREFEEFIPGSEDVPDEHPNVPQADEFGSELTPGTEQ